MSLFRKSGRDGLKKMDAVITGLIVGSAVAAVYGARRRARSGRPEAGSARPGLLRRLLSFFFRG